MDLTVDHQHTGAQQMQMADMDLFTGGKNTGVDSDVVGNYNNVYNPLLSASGEVAQNEPNAMLGLIMQRLEQMQQANELRFGAIEGKIAKHKPNENCESEISYQASNRSFHLGPEQTQMQSSTGRDNRPARDRSEFLALIGQKPAEDGNNCDPPQNTINMEKSIINEYCEERDVSQNKNGPNVSQLLGDMATKFWREESSKDSLI